MMESSTQLVILAGLVIGLVYGAVGLLSGFCLMSSMRGWLAEGDGRLSVAIKRPWPEHPNGRVTIRCLSGAEESSADFEPELWFHEPGAIVTFESPMGEASGPVVEGKEVILGRYVARNIPRDIRVTFRAVFSRDPLAPRVKAGLKPPR